MRILKSKKSELNSDINTITYSQNPIISHHNQQFKIIHRNTNDQQLKSDAEIISETTRNHGIKSANESKKNTGNNFYIGYD